MLLPPPVYNLYICVPQVSTTSMESEALERFCLEDSGTTMTTSSEDLDMALHNQLLSRSADAHISMKQYENAVTYLEQARDIQDVLEDDIKGRWVRIRLKVGGLG